MRIGFSGYSGPLPPIVLELTGDVPFVPGEYIDLGYTNYDVMCIGGAGGHGGGVDDTSGESGFHRALGGAGGGGGAHRVQGVLSGLPSTCVVVLGEAGANAFDIANIADIDDLEPGMPGGLSSFNDTTCRAAGGGGGQPVLAVDTLGGIGGYGGLGDTVSPGTGAAPETGLGLLNGGWDGTIGSGGAGGRGGSGSYTDYGVFYEGTVSSRGSYSAEDPSFYGYAAGPRDEIHDGGSFSHIVPGEGGGARATLLTGRMYVYGSKYGDNVSGDGGVIVRLTRV